MSFIREHIVKTIESYTGKRSSKWPKVRKAYVKIHSCCEICGRKKGVEVHHKKDFSTYPDLELEFDNLISLCRKRCHLLFGHLLNWKSINPTVATDAWWWNEKIENRRG